MRVEWVLNVISIRLWRQESSAESSNIQRSWDPSRNVAVKDQCLSMFAQGLLEHFSSNSTFKLVVVCDTKIKGHDFEDHSHKEADTQIPRQVLAFIAESVGEKCMFGHLTLTSSWFSSTWFLVITWSSHASQAFNWQGHEVPRNLCGGASASDWMSQMSSAHWTPQFLRHLLGRQICGYRQEDPGWCLHEAWWRWPCRELFLGAWSGPYPDGASQRWTGTIGQEFGAVHLPHVGETAAPWSLVYILGMQSTRRSLASCENCSNGSQVSATFRRAQCNIVKIKSCGRTVENRNGDKLQSSETLVTCIY